MHRIFLRTSLVASAALALVGCDQLSQLGLGPPPAASAPSASPPAPIADIRPQAGAIYSDFAAAEGASFIPSSSEDRAALFGAFVLDRALRELGRELHRGGDFVGIPLAAVAEQLDASSLAAASSSPQPERGSRSIRAL